MQECLTLQLKVGGCGLSASIITRHWLQVKAPKKVAIKVFILAWSYFNKLCFVLFFLIQFFLSAHFCRNPDVIKSESQNGFLKLCPLSILFTKFFCFLYIEIKRKCQQKCTTHDNHNIIIQYYLWRLFLLQFCHQDLMEIMLHLYWKGWRKAFQQALHPLRLDMEWISHFSL